MDHSRSLEMFERAKKILVGGVNSPVRAFKSVEGEPVFFASAKGAHMTDVDGNDYIDYVGSWGPMILGHAHPDVTIALISAVEDGTSFGAPGEKEHLLGELVASMVPGVEKVRFVNSGTEATMSALRLARGATGRTKMIKFEGCYHGHGDSFLIKAGSGAMTFGVPDSRGVTENIAKDTLTAQFNDLDSVTVLFDQNPDQIAAVIVEPVAGNMGVIPPQGDFLKKLHALCKDRGALLICDEVMTGFRVAAGGAQSIYNIVPDITTLGKIIGGGLPVGAYGASAKLMSNISPEGGIYQGGTLSGNPLAMTAGIATLERLDNALYGKLESYGAKLQAGLQEVLEEAEVPATINRVGSMMTVFFTTEKSVTNFAAAAGCNTARFGKFHRLMLEQGVYLPPSQFEAWFISGTHGEGELEKTLEAAKIAAGTL